MTDLTELLLERIDSLPIEANRQFGTIYLSQSLKVTLTLKIEPSEL